MSDASIEPKVGAGLVGGAASTLAVGLLGRYTSYAPTPEEAGAIVMLSSFVVAWIVPTRLWRKSDGADDPAPPPPVA